MPSAKKKKVAPRKNKAAAAKKKAATKSKKATSRGKKSARPDPERVARILDALARGYSKATTALRWEDPLQLLVATILSAQCTDERVNRVTPELFAAFPDAASLAAAPAAEIERIIHSTGFFRAKARSIQGACRLLAERHGGQVPAQMEQLLELPGVARKTANVVLGTAFGISSGVVVDTHVKRLSGRLGMTPETDPQKIERDLMQVVPQEQWIFLGHALILHGRAVCKARKPLCGACALAADCPSAEV
jgi:endonuclease-3